MMETKAAFGGYGPPVELLEQAEMEFERIFYLHNQGNASDGLLDKILVEQIKNAFLCGYSRGYLTAYPVDPKANS